MILPSKYAGGKRKRHEQSQTLRAAPSWIWNRTNRDLVFAAEDYARSMVWNRRCRRSRLVIIFMRIVIVAIIGAS